jgi:hypothetical protein
MREKSFDVLVQLVDSFRHVGWVNGLSVGQYDALNKANDYIKQVEDARNFKNNRVKIAKTLREEGYTIREIAATLGYKHPGSITNLLK